MTHSTSSDLLVRRLLLADAIVSGATGVLMAAAAPMLESWLGLPAALLRYAGFVLLPFAAVVGRLGMQDPVARTGVRAVIATNFAWVAASILLLVIGGVTPTSLGIAFVLFQAGVVLVLGELQFMALRKAAKIA
jgi:hypothetical protein